MDEKAKYCDDADCPNFGNNVGGECDIGFEVIFRVPRGYDDIQTANWGYVRPSQCKKMMKLKANYNTVQQN